MRDPWKTLENRIQEAKDRAKATDQVVNMERLTKCEICGGRMLPVGVGILKCKNCGNETETGKAKIKRALEEYPGLTAHELADITGVPYEDITAYLDDGFLEIKSPSKDYLSCKMCGIKIVSGTVCEKCKGVYKTNFGNYNVRTGNLVKSSVPSKSERLDVPKTARLVGNADAGENKARYIYKKNNEN